MLVLATNEQFLVAGGIFRAILANESHWLQPVLVLSVHWWLALTGVGRVLVLPSPTGYMMVWSPGFSLSIRCIFHGFLKSWTSTGWFLNSNASSVTSSQFSLFIVIAFTWAPHPSIHPSLGCFHHGPWSCPISKGILPWSHFHGPICKKMHF